MDEKSVTFAVKDYNNAGQWKELTVSGEEFIRRFLMHVPPKRFVRIRHYVTLVADIWFLPRLHMPADAGQMDLCDVKALRMNTF